MTRIRALFFAALPARFAISFPHKNRPIHIPNLQPHPPTVNNSNECQPIVHFTRAAKL